ncbi:MAG: hypothetical protein GX640_10550, partial [Fibrobacter sp.]|nr:hypothetical protein [Fibrobacter sp.]
MNENQQLYLIDGHALVYRAYFAFSKNPLVNSKGQSTGAIFGFANYLLRLIENYSCPYLAVVLDSSTPTFRHQMYAEYKANREAMPDELKSQMPLILNLIEALNITVIREDGLEADDLIAMLTKKALDRNFSVFLVTKDKDLMQLIGPNVKMLAPDGSGTLQLLGVNEVIEKMGVGPEQIVDYLALIGDSSDNIPGVPGVGPKTAVKILQTAGSVDLILENPSVLGNEKLISKIEENRELLRISKVLATLKYDCETQISIDSLQRKPVNRTDCIALFRELEFTSLIRHPLFSGTSRQTFTPTFVLTDSQLSEMVELLRDTKIISISTLTSDSVPRSSKLTGIGISVNKSDSFYIPLCNENNQTFLPVQTVLDALRGIIESSEIKKIGHNLKFKYQVFKNYGIQMNGIFFDTMIAAYLIDSGKKAYELDVMASEILNIELSFRADLSGNFLSSKDTPVLTDDKTGEFAAEQVCIQFSLMEELSKKLDELNARSLFDSIEIPLIKVLADLEWEGILVDTMLLSSLSTEYGAVLKNISDEIFNLAGGPLNINSPKQVGEILFEKMMLPGSKKTKTGGYSTNVDVLEKLAPDYPIVQKILDYREVQKLLST